MYSIPAFRFHGNVVGRVARKSCDTWLLLIVASKDWPAAMIVTAVISPEVVGAAAALVGASDGAAEVAGVRVSGVAKQAPRTIAAAMAVSAARVFFMAGVLGR